MKSVLQHLILASLLALVARAQVDAILPPKELRGEWTELKAQKGIDWTIKSFLGWDVPGDGGSKVFFFESKSGERFDIMAANPAYWTAEDLKRGRQVFYLITKDRFYRIDPKSDEERIIVSKLVTAKATLSGAGKKDPRLLDGLIEHLKCRTPMFKPKP